RLLCRVLPPGKAGLRFAVWFSALGAIGLVPLLQHASRGSAGAVPAMAAHSMLLLSPRWATYLFWPWVLIAGAGLVRVIASAFHLHRVAAASTVVNPAELD